MRAAEFTRPLAYLVLFAANAFWCTCLTGNVQWRLSRAEPASVCAVRSVLAEMNTFTPPAMEEAAVAEAQVTVTAQPGETER